MARVTNEEDDHNAAIVAGLRDEFLPLLRNLTGGTEPALVFTLLLEESASDE